MNEELKNILSRVDHTLLSQTATWEQIRAICDDGVKYGCASVCIPASYVKQAAEYVDGKIAVCTVIGFPNGYDTTAAKCFEAADAVKNGASEIDMVINLGWVKDGLYDRVLEEIKAIKGHCDGRLLRSSSRRVCSPMRRRSKCAAWCPSPARTTSRPPPASAEAVPPARTWRCSRPMSRPM